MQIGYGILLDGKVFNFMRGAEIMLQDKFGFEKGLRQSPHVTVKPPFETEDLTPYLEYLETLCSETDTFKIKFKGFNSFGKKVIYLDVMPNEKLMSIYKKITKDLDLPEDDMIFHGTLAYGDVEEDKFDEAINLLKNNFDPEFEVTARQIGLFYQLSNDEGWVVIKKCNLNN